MRTKFPFLKYHGAWIGVVFIALVSAFVAENGTRFNLNQGVITILFVIYCIAAVISLIVSTYYVGRKTAGTKLEAFGWSILMIFNAVNAFAVGASLIDNRDSWLILSVAIGLFQSWVFYRFVKRL